MKKRKPWTLKGDKRYRKIYREIHGWWDTAGAGFVVVRCKTLAECDFKHRMLIAYDNPGRPSPYLITFFNEVEYDRIKGVRRRHTQYMVIVRSKVKPFILKDKHNEKKPKRSV